MQTRTVERMARMGMTIEWDFSTHITFVGVKPAEMDA